MKDDFFENDPQDELDELDEFSVDWLWVNSEDIKRMEKEYWETLESANREENIQQFLKEHPYLLIRWLSGGHGRWVIPKPKFGDRYVPDFIVAHKDSIGYHWTLVELESPIYRIFTKSGDYTKETNHAIRQVFDWREWLKQNLEYAQKPANKGGLGLDGISPNSKALILIGRRDKDKNPNLRAQSLEQNIEIHSYEWLLSNPTIWPKTTKNPDKKK